MVNDCMSLETLEANYSFLADIFEPFPHASPACSFLRCCWKEAVLAIDSDAESAKVYPLTCNVEQMCKEDSERLWDNWSYCWQLTRRSDSPRSKIVAVTRLKQRLKQRDSGGGSG